MDLTAWVERAALLLEALGVATIVLGVPVAAVAAARKLRGARAELFTSFRATLAGAILLGLEFLVGADIVRTVSGTPTLRGVLVLGGIVLIRTFLSFTLEWEVSGRPPWRRDPRA